MNDASYAVCMTYVGLNKMLSFHIVHPDENYRIDSNFILYINLTLSWNQESQITDVQSVIIKYHIYLISFSTAATMHPFTRSIHNVETAPCVDNIRSQDMPSSVYDIKILIENINLTSAKRIASFKKK